MLRQYLHGMEGIDIFGILSMIIFFGYFTIIVIHTMKMKKEDESSFSQIPLEEDKNNSTITNE